MSTTPDPGKDIEMGLPSNNKVHPSSQDVNCLVIFEFTVTGMTCVACSSTIERAMHTEFDPKKMIDFSIALLTHKMEMTFEQKTFKNKEVTPDMICEEVEMIGFECALKSIVEINKEQYQRSKISKNDQDSAGKNGNENEDDQGESVQSLCLDDDQQSDNDGKKQGIKTSKIKTVRIKLESKQSKDFNKTDVSQTNQNLMPTVLEKSLETILSDTLQGIVQTQFNEKTDTLTVHFKPDILALRDLITKVQEQGFPKAQIVPEAPADSLQQILNKEMWQYRKKFLLTLLIQLPIWGQLWILPYAWPESLISGDIFNGNTVYLIIIFVLATIIQFVSGYNFYQGAYKSIRAGSANMDVLVVLGTTAAWLYGVILMGFGHDLHINHQSSPDMTHEDMIEMLGMKIQMHAHNFEISSTLITVILLGKLLEVTSKKQTVDKLSQLASLKATKACVLPPDSQLDLTAQGEEMAIEMVKVGDYVKILNGQTVPIDGVVAAGSGICNESMLTGEARPVEKKIGVKVFGGSQLTVGTVIIKVDKLSENSTISQIIKLVETAQSQKAPIQGVADKIAKVFVPTIVVLAVLTWAFWFTAVYATDWQFDLKKRSQFEYAFNFGISTLVIACPCALGLATPTAVMVGTGIAAKFGVMIKGGSVLEKINQISMVVFDKTGTLTSGKPQVTQIIDLVEQFKVEVPEKQKDLTSDNLHKLTQLCESSSEHPIAQQIVLHLNQKLENSGSNQQTELKSFKNVNGEGVIAQVVLNNTEFEVAVGNDKLMLRQKVDLEQNNLKFNIEQLELTGKTVVSLAVDGVPRLLIALEEEHLCKAEAQAIVKYLQGTLHMKVAMITGDNKHSAFKVADYCGIQREYVTYKAYPADKKKTVQKFQANGEKVMFIGDGVNDSPVLAQANIGVAVAAAADVTVQAAEIVCMKDNLGDVLNAILISKATLRRIKLNFGWAFIYNIVLVPVAMGVLVPFIGVEMDPMWAGFAMAMSSVSVVMSSLWLKCFKYKHLVD